MRRLIVHYREDDDSISECLMMGFVPFGDNRCSAFSLASAFMRPLHYDRITDSYDFETGEVISIRDICGACPTPGVITASTLRQPRPKGKQRGHGNEAFKGQRKKDSNTFFIRYRRDIIWNHFRNNLIGLFNGRCFACDSPEGLQLDHHIPLIRGGRREPGNIVMLCFRCNQKKWDYSPELFYSLDELAHLEPLLSHEEEILAFEFDAKQWTENPFHYLHNIGLNPLLVNEIKTNPNHPWAEPLAPLVQCVITATLTDPIK